MPESVPMTSDILPLLSLGLAILVQTGIVAYFGGKMAQRMISAEKRIGEQDAKIETKIADQNLLVEKVVRLQVQMEHNTSALEKIAHTMEGVNRQLGNIAMGRIGVSGEM